MMEFLNNKPLVDMCLTVFLGLLTAWLVIDLTIVHYQNKKKK